MTASLPTVWHRLDRFLARLRPHREPLALPSANAVGIAQTLAGKTALITGAGGSIGSALCRRVVRYAPARLVLVELSEFNPHTIEQALTESIPPPELVRLIGNVKDLEHLRSIFARWRPQVVS